MSTTPRFTKHARQRCVEMGLTTKAVKRIYRSALIDYPGPIKHGEGNRIKVGDGIAIAYKIDETGSPMVCTVLYAGTEFVRPTASGGA
jgi:hypothetical protein